MNVIDYHLLTCGIALAVAGAAALGPPHLATQPPQPPPSPLAAIASTPNGSAALLDEGLTLPPEVRALLPGSRDVPSAFAPAPLAPRSSLVDAYADEIHKQLDLFVAYPLEAIELGDFGEMEGKVFKRLGNITRKFGIKVVSTTKVVGPFTYSSSGDVGVDIDVGAKDSKGDYAIDVKVSFAKEKNVLLKLDSMSIDSIKNIGAVGDQLVDLYKEKGKDWKRSYVVVTQLQHSKGGALLVSKDKDGKVTLSGKAAVKQTGVKLADVDLRNFTIGSSKGLGISQTWSTDCAPLLQLHEVKDPFPQKAFFTEYK